MNNLNIIDKINNNNIPQWLYIFYEIYENGNIRGLLRQTCKYFNHLDFIAIDKTFANVAYREGWYFTTKDYELIADDSDEGIKKYDYYQNKYDSAKLFIEKNYH